MKMRIAALALAGVALGIWQYDQQLGTGASMFAAARGAAETQSFGQPVGEVVLRVTQGAEGESVDLAAFDMAMLQNMPKYTFETNTMWTEGPQVFEGVELKTFLDALGVTSGILAATAINDYRIEIPVHEIEAGGPMIAYARNGEPMSVREKGPLWIVYPYDANPNYQTEVVFSRSIWQLDRLAITP